VQFIVRLLRYHLLFGFDDYPRTNLHTASYSHTCPDDNSLPDHHTMPHNHATHLRVTCLPETYGHQTKSWKDCVQRLHRKDLQRCWLLFDANDNTSSNYDSQAHNNAMPNHHTMSHYHALPHNQTYHLQELLLSCWVRHRCKAREGCVQLNIWMLSDFLLLGNHNNSSPSHNYPLPHYHTVPHDHTADLCFACLPEANGH
jgi:hypothetical protein